MSRAQTVLLLIHDDPGDAVLIREALARTGDSTCSLDCAHGLAAGLERIAQGGVDVILLGIGEAGLDTLQRLRAAIPKSVGIIALLDESGTCTAAHARAAGARDSLIRSRLTADLLAHTIHSATSRPAHDKLDPNLVEASQMLKLVLGSMPAFVFWKDRNSVYLGCNDRFAANAGLRSPDDIVGLTDLDLPWKHTEAEKYRADDRLVIEAGIPRLNYEETQLTADGRVTVVRTSKTPLRDSAGQVIGVLGTFEDITEQKRAEQMLAEAEAKYRCLVEESLVGVYLIQAGRFAYVNACMAGIFGYTPEEVIGRPVEDLVAPEDREMVTSSVRNREVGRVVSAHYIFRGLRKDGQTIHVEVLGTRTMYQGLPAVIGSLLDISERRRSEAMLHRVNRELRAITSCNETLLRATSEQALIDDVCRIVCQEAGYRMAWVGYAQHDAARRVRPVAWAGVEDGYLRTLDITWAEGERGRGPTGMAIRTGRSSCFSDFATDPDAKPWRAAALERGYRSSIALPLKDEHSRVFGTLTIYSTEPYAFAAAEIRLLEELAGDLAFGITTLRAREQHKRAEQSIALLSFAMNNVREGVFLVDAQSRFCHVNEEACRALGYGRDELLRMRVSDIDPDFSVEHWPGHWDDLRTQGALTFESRHRTRDGRTLPVEVSTSYFEYEGSPYTLALVRNITERKRTEEALRRSRDEADAASRAKDQFLAALSHELRTPLTPVLATVTALEDQPGLSPELRADLETIHRNVALETKLIDDLLDLTRLTRGTLELHHEVTDAHECARAALKVCGDMIRARQLTVEIEFNAPVHHVWADPVRLQQAFWNLLQNAAKFTPPQGVIRLISRNRDDRLLVDVQDTGIGIHPAMLQRIFRPFEQTERTRSHRFGGLGMGLAIARNIIELHHGQITAASDGPDRGATFTVDLAGVRPEPTSAAPPAAPLARQSAGQRVLLVEDVADTRKIVARLLRSWGHIVTCADSVSTAIAIADREPFDLLLSDIGLPDGSGLEIMRHVKQKHGLKGIALSGYGMEDDIAASLAAGFAQHLTKPVSAKSLQAAIAQVVAAA